MEEINFLKWFELQFYPSVKHLTETGPVVMFFDGHYSHLSISLIKKARDLKIHLFCLPPNTTHILQPLDVGVFGPVKSTWRKILKQYKIRTRAANNTKEVFPSLIKELWDESVTPQHLQGGFKSAGLAPFDPSAVKASRLSPSLVTAIRISPQSPAIQLHGVETLRVGAMETPIRVELRAFFVQELRPPDGVQKVRRRCRVELSDLGEVLTSDEVVERLELAEAEKAKKKAEKEKTKAARKGKGKKGKKGTTASSEVSGEHIDETTCSKCGQVYTEEEAEDWIGCDECDTTWPHSH